MPLLTDNICDTGRAGPSRRFDLPGPHWYASEARLAAGDDVMAAMS